MPPSPMQPAAEALGDEHYQQDNFTQTSLSRKLKVVARCRRQISLGVDEPAQHPRVVHKRGRSV